MGNKKIIKMKKYALVSLYNKNNIEYLCSILQKHKINIISTGQTSVYIKKYGYCCTNISRLTNFKEILSGRVKTLHPNIHASLLFDRNNLNHLNDFKLLKFPKIDYVIVDLYPFDKIFFQKVSFNQSIELIDIGGVSMLRSAAKNFKYITAISNINDYKNLERNLNSNFGSTSIEFRKRMAAKVFEKTSLYDSFINKWFLKEKYDNFLLSDKFKTNLRYGENPHQQSFFYSFLQKNSITKNIIQGKKISYNNLLDINSALDCINEFKTPTCIIIKHNNPCGVSSKENIDKAYLSAKNSDPVSSFGGIIIFNRNVGKEITLKIIKDFYEVVIAPNFSKESLKIFSNKKNLILIRSKNIKIDNKMDIRSITGGYLFQNKNNVRIKKKDIKLVSKKNVSQKLLDDLLFAFRVCKHVKSNAIVLVKNQQTIGIGAGQMSRIDATKIAIKKRKYKKTSFVAASDAFFPFIDNISLLVKNNCKAIIQPQGSINDSKIINFSNKKNLSLYFSKYRFFKH